MRVRLAASGTTISVPSGQITNFEFCYDNNNNNNNSVSDADVAASAADPLGSSEYYCTSIRASGPHTTSSLTTCQIRLLFVCLWSIRRQCLFWRTANHFCHIPHCTVLFSSRRRRSVSGNSQIKSDLKRAHLTNRRYHLS